MHQAGGNDEQSQLIGQVLQIFDGSNIGIVTADIVEEIQGGVQPVLCNSRSVREKIFSKCFAINGRYDAAAMCEAAAAGAQIPRLSIPNLEAVMIYVSVRKFWSITFHTKIGDRRRILLLPSSQHAQRF